MEILLGYDTWPLLVRSPQPRGLTYAGPVLGDVYSEPSTS